MLSTTNLKFISASTQFMEDANVGTIGSVAYKATFAKGKSGLSFGIYQTDVAVNQGAKKTLYDSLVKLKQFDIVDIQRIITLASTKGITADKFSPDDITKINNALSNNKQAVDALNDSYFDNTLTPWINQVDALPLIVMHMDQVFLTQTVVTF